MLPFSISLQVQTNTEVLDTDMAWNSVTCTGLKPPAIAPRGLVLGVKIIAFKTMMFSTA